LKKNIIINIFVSSNINTSQAHYIASNNSITSFQLNSQAGLQIKLSSAF
jgi:hypothetical protein